MDYYNKLINRINDGHNFAKVSNVRLTRVEKDYAEGELEITKDSLNMLGYVHGGLLCTLADTVAGSAAYTRGNVCVTLNCSMNFLKQADGSKIRCTAVAKKVGRTISVFETTSINDRDEIVTVGTFTFFTKEQVVAGYEG